MEKKCRSKWLLVQQQEHEHPSTRFRCNDMNIITFENEKILKLKKIHMAFIPQSDIQYDDFMSPISITVFFPSQYFERSRTKRLTGNFNCIFLLFNFGYYFCFVLSHFCLTSFYCYGNVILLHTFFIQLLLARDLLSTIRYLCDGCLRVRASSTQR